MFFQGMSNDASFLGWVIMAAYLSAALLCGIATRQVTYLFHDPYTRQHQLVWGSTTLAMLFLGLNKQLDSQIIFSRGFYWVIHITEKLFLKDGNAGDIIRPLFISGLGGLGLVASIGLVWYMRHIWRYYWLLAFGVLLTAGFVVERAAGFYQVGLFLGSRFPVGSQLNGALELLGAATIAAAAGINLWRGKKARQVKPIEFT